MSAMAMPNTAPGLKLGIGQFSDRGRKAENQDFHGARIPRDALLRQKGAALALADGISSSPVSRIGQRHRGADVSG